MLSYIPNDPVTFGAASSVVDSEKTPDLYASRNDDSLFNWRSRRCMIRERCRDPTTMNVSVARYNMCARLCMLVCNLHC